MKTGLVLEGGAMRGMFTTGVLDVLMEQGIDRAFDGAIGVSAGATFGCNIKSHQIGRAIRYNKAFCKDPRYCSFREWLKSGDLFGREFCYRTLPYELDLFDTDTFAANPLEFYIVTTDCETGEAVYHRLTDGGYDDVDWIGASASMPVFARPVEIEGRAYLDGGVSDSIPLAAFEGMGFARNVVVLTRPRGFRSTKEPGMPAIRVALRRYPAIVEGMATRHIGYNKTLEYIAAQEAAGATFVIAPPAPIPVGHIEHNPDRLEAAYQMGRETATAALPALREFLGLSSAE